MSKRPLRVAVVGETEVIVGCAAAEAAMNRNKNTFLQNLSHGYWPPRAAFEN